MALGTLGQPHLDISSIKFFMNKQFAEKSTPLRVCMPVHSFYLNDSRVRRCSKSLAEAGYLVDVLAFWPPTKDHPTSKQTDIDGIKLHQIVLNNKGGKARFVEMMLQLWKYAKMNLDIAHIIHCNDLDTLAPSVFLANNWGAKLIYDSHEWYTGSIHVGHRAITRAIWTFIEKTFLPNVDHLITVNQSIADRFKSTYKDIIKCPVTVIRNFDQVDQEVVLNHQILPEKLKSFLDRFEHLVVYGGYLQRGRGLEALLHQMPKTSSSIGLVIAGEGNIEAELKDLCQNMGLTGRVFFCGQLSLSDLNLLYKQCDIGYCYIEPIAESYKMALPNKLSQYAQNELCIIGSNLVEIRRLIEKHHLGLVIEHPNELPTAIAQLINNKVYYKEQLQKNKHELSWEKESATLLSLYEQLYSDKGTSDSLLDSSSSESSST